MLCLLLLHAELAYNQEIVALGLANFAGAMFGRCVQKVVAATLMLPRAVSMIVQAVSLVIYVAKSCLPVSGQFLFPGFVVTLVRLFCPAATPPLAASAAALLTTAVEPRHPWLAL